MAKKATAETIEVAPQKEIVTQVTTSVKPTKPTWEIKDRVYYLNKNKKPLSYTIPTRHSRKTPLLYFDKKQVNKKKLDMLQIKTLYLLMNKKVRLQWGTLSLETVI